MNQEQLKKKINEVIQKIQTKTPNYLLIMAHRALAMIVQRTDRGIDADGQKFKSYDPKYKKRKRKLRGDLRWLHLTNDMFNNIVTELIRGKKAKIYLRKGISAGQSASPHDKAWYNRDRWFMGLTDTEDRKITDYFLRQMEDVIKNAYR